MIYTFLGLSLLFAFVGFIITPNNAKYILNGYKELSEEERHNFDLKAFLSFHRNFHVVFSLIFLVSGIAALEFSGGFAAGLVLGLGPLIAYLYYMVISIKYYKNINTSFSSKNVLIAAIILTSITIVLVLTLFIYGNKQNILHIEDDYIHITGMYGERIKMSDIESFDLVDSMPKIRMKSNGYAVGDIRKGYFKMEDGTKSKLIVNKQSSPFILIVKSDGSKIYYTSPEDDTQSLYTDLISKF